jgi:hypothetical protein
MRLLQVDKNGECSLTDDLIGSIPPCAILSHTWGADREEVSLKDLTTCSKKTSFSYQKLRYYAVQFAQDDLQYFWVDTCCTIQTHHRRQCPTKRVAHAAENGS